MKSIFVSFITIILLSVTAATSREVQYHRQRAVQLRQQAVRFADRAEILNHQADSIARVGDTIRARELRNRADVELGKSLSYIRAAAKEDEKAKSPK